MYKVLFTATVVKRHIMQFHIPYLKMFKEMGWETAVAARNDYENPDNCVIPHCDAYFDLPFERSPLKRGNINAYVELKKIIDSGNYKIIHCHTPVGAMLTRIAARKARRNGVRVIYTAHGFHFYKGAPLKNWLLYFPVEWLCSFMTDTLVTINKEDYAFALKHMHSKRVEYVPGVGIDLNKFNAKSKSASEKRRELGIPDGMTWVLNTGELIPRKNQESLIRAAANAEAIYLTIAGDGELYDYLTGLIHQLHIENRVRLLGYRTDVSDLCRAADIFVLPSFQEGLPVAVMEAMACGLPCVVSKIRGNVDLIEDGNGGFLFAPEDAEELTNKLQFLMQHPDKASAMGKFNLEHIAKFSDEAVLRKMREIYKQSFAEEAAAKKREERHSRDFNARSQCEKF